MNDRPSQPERPYFDRVQHGWVLSRYGDVLAALREPRLCQIGPGTKTGRCCDERKPASKRADARGVLTNSKLAEWRDRIEFLAGSMFDQLPEDRPVELVHQFIWPWSLAVTLVINGFAPDREHRLADLAYYLPGGETDWHNSILRSRAAASFSELSGSVRKRAGVGQLCRSSFRLLFQLLHCSLASAAFAVPKRVANSRLQKLDRDGSLPLGLSVFLGTSQTISLFLANAWHALLRHPAELARLRSEPELMSRAIEELLRYAGVVHTLFRHAGVTVDLAGVRILENERVILKVQIANRDPAQFPEPNRLDIGRRVPGQVGLGAGPHSCAGALLVRMAAGIATSAFVQRFSGAETIGSVEWCRNGTVCSPASLPVSTARAQVLSALVRP